MAIPCHEQELTAIGVLFAKRALVQPSRGSLTLIAADETRNT